jgi:hypothetical protein
VRGGIEVEEFEVEEVEVEVEIWRGIARIGVWRRNLRLGDGVVII